MKKNNCTENDYRTAALLRLFPKIFLLLIVIISIIKGLFGEIINPLDNSINKNQEIIENVIVVDSTNNGFRIVFATKNSVTKERLDEIQCRKEIQFEFNRLRIEAPIHFKNDLLHTDIYDFAEFSLKYPLNKEIQVHDIFIYGKDKTNLYANKNSKIENCASWIDKNTEQGVQYLSHDDIYFRRRKRDRIYRYWKCFGLNATSLTDERYAHFSEDERQW